MRDFLSGSPPVDTLTEFESYGSPSLEETTSDTPLVKVGYPYTTEIKSAGTYSITYSIQAGQSSNGKISQAIIEWRIGTSGTWLELINIEQALPTTGFVPWSGFSIVTLPNDSVFQVRISYANPGQGSCLIREANITLGKVSG